MNALELILPTETIKISFNDHIDKLSNEMSGYNFEYFANKSETLDEYLSFFSLGFDLLFEDKIFTSVFLYIDHKAGKYERYKIRCSYLGKSFWENPSLDNFISTIKINKFKALETRSKFTTKFVKNDLYAVYSKRPDKVRVSFGLESRL